MLAWAKIHDTRRVHQKNLRRKFFKCNRLRVKMLNDLEKAESVYQVPVGDCVPNDWNPNEMDDAAFNRLAREIEETGMINPIQVVRTEDGKYTIIGGEHRWRVVKVLGHEFIDATILTDKKFDGEDIQKFLTVRQNVLHGSLNPKKMAVLYEEMAERYGAETLQDLFAFTDKDEWNYYTGSVKKGLEKAGVPKEIVQEFDEKVKEVKAVDDLGAILNQLFSRHGHSLQYNFMVFAFGGMDHYYIRMNDRMLSAMKSLARFCHNHQMDINLAVAPAIEKLRLQIKTDKKFVEMCKFSEDEYKAAVKEKLDKKKSRKKHKKTGYKKKHKSKEGITGGGNE
jgi:hypothetical protein